MLILRSLPWTFRYLEWIYITAHFGMSNIHPGYNSPVWCYGVFFLLGWFYPCTRPYWQRLFYIIVGLAATICFRRIGIDLGLFLFFYIAKSYFLLHRQITIFITILTGIVWTSSEYLAEVDRWQSVIPPASQIELNPHNPLKFFFFTLIVYTSVSIFVIMFTSMAVAEQKSRQQALELAQEVELLVATLERTRIAREIHDSLGHTLTDLDIQLAVAQQLRFDHQEIAFQAIDTAKMLSRQCIEDVSQALNKMRQSDFDLNQALIGLLEQVRYNSTTQVHWKVNLPKLSVNKSYQIYCIVKEAIVNVQKHARASSMSFYASFTSQEIVLDLKDNGIGFEPEKLDVGFGIQGMMERVQLLGGEFKINAALGQGTQIQVTLPL